MSYFKQQKFLLKTMLIKFYQLNQIKLNPNLLKMQKYNLTSNVKNIVLGILLQDQQKMDIENYINLATKLNKIHNCKFIIAAGKDDKEIIGKIKNSEIGKNCFSLEKLSIQEILPIIKNCNLYIGNDTGFMHISSALGIKSIGIFVDSPAYYKGNTEDGVFQFYTKIIENIPKVKIIIYNF